MSDNLLKRSYLLRLTTVLLCISLIVFIGVKLQFVIVPVIFSLIFSVMLLPMVKRMEAWKFPRGIAAFCALLVGCTIVGVLIYFLGNQMSALSKQGPQLVQKLDTLIWEIRYYVSSHFGIEYDKQTEQIENQMSQLAEDGTKIAGVIVSSVANFVTDLILIPLFVFFLLYFRSFFLEFFHRVFDTTDNTIIDDILAKMHTIIQSWLVGVILVMLIVGVLNTIGLFILGIPYAAFFGFLAAFLLIFPFIGIILGSALPVLMALITKDSYWYAVGVVGIFWFIQIVEANLITPYIVGSKISINPLIAILVLLLFGNMWGISGLILALPITAICKVIFDTIPETQAFGFVLGEPPKKHLRARPSFRIKFKTTKHDAEKDIVVDK